MSIPDVDLDYIRKVLRTRLCSFNNGILQTRSYLKQLSLEQIEYCLQQGYIIPAQNNYYSITPLGSSFVDKSAENAEINNLQEQQTVSLFKECWKNNDFTGCSARQRKDFKELGLVLRKAYMFYLPTIKGCEVLSISMEEAETKYREDCLKFYGTKRMGQPSHKW